MLLAFVLVFSCRPKDSQTIEGDLFFRVIDFQRMFDYPDSILTKIEYNVKTVKTDTLSQQDKKIYSLLKYLIDNNLLRTPFIRLKLDDDTEKMLFLDISDYKQFKVYHWDELSREKKKIRVKALATELHYDSLTAFKATKLISVLKIDGQTQRKK